MWWNLLTMRSAVELLCALTALVPMVYCLSCIACLEYGSETCDGASVLCPSEKVCGTSLIEVTRKDGLKYYNVRRNCRYQNRCQKSFHFSHTHYRSRQQITCCNSDNCTPPQPTWLEFDSKTNGLSCPTCAYPSFDCLAKGDYECAGEMNQCYTQLQTIQGSGVFSTKTFRGCSTESLCQFGNWTEMYGSLILESTVICTDANNANSYMSTGLLSVFMYLLYIVLCQ